MVGTITWETKGKAKERPAHTQPAGTKEGRELVLLVVGSYLTHNPSNVTYMKIVKSKKIGGLKQTSPAKAMFLSITKVKAR
jgi:hypothetical protein